MTSNIAESVREVLPGVRADLESLVAIQSVWADPARRPEVHRSAAAVAELLRTSGFPEVDIVSEGGAPAVIARYPAPDGAPTVLLYAHHDVQPEGDHSLWDTEPFSPTQQGDRIFARGVADDKAGIAAHLAAFRAHGGKPPLGVTVFVEGEEESGSASLPALLDKYRDRLASDVIVIADSGNWDIGVPALTISLRGLVDCAVEVSTLDHAVHSGMWGGAVPDALMVLSRLLATLHDDEGNVAVDGLSERTAADLDYSESRLRAESGLLDGVSQIGTGSVVDRLWEKPAVSILGIDCPPATGAANALVPRATAKVSLRIPPGQPAGAALDLLVAHLESHVPWGAHVEVTRGDTGEAYAIDATGPAYDAARSAFEEAWGGVAPVDMGVGGSIPFIALFHETFPNAAILVTGVEDPDTRAHGANEGLHWPEFEKVCLAEALLLDKLANS